VRAIVAGEESNGGNGSSGTVSYSIKELLDGIKTSIDRLYGKLDTKADRSEVLELSRQINHESKRVDALETTYKVETQNESEHREWTKWLIPAIIAIAMLGVSILQLFGKR
jgi:uncharacterized circularly permuted ATP-grasp superfamily protein